MKYITENNPKGSNRSVKRTQHTRPDLSECFQRGVRSARHQTVETNVDLDQKSFTSGADRSRTNYDKSGKASRKPRKNSYYASSK